MPDPRDRIAQRALSQIRWRQRKLDEFDALLAKRSVPEPTRSILRQWVEEHLLVPALEIAETQLRQMDENK